LQPKGSVADETELQQISNPDVGDMYTVTATGHMWYWTGDDWDDLGQVKGDKGDKGDKGEQGDPGNTGSTGATGSRGTGWFTGSGAPVEPIAGTIAGDLYLDAVSGNVYTLTGA
jgi:hypothetical protein